MMYIVHMREEGGAADPARAQLIAYEPPPFSLGSLLNCGLGWAGPGRAGAQIRSQKAESFLLFPTLLALEMQVRSKKGRTHIYVSVHLFFWWC
jgi:hypothetical protein